MSNKNKIILQYPTKGQYNTFDNIPGSKSRDSRRLKLKMKIEAHQHRFKANGKILNKKTSRVKRKHRSETSSNLKQEDSSSQPLNTKATTSSNFLANTKKTKSPFAEDSQEFETADSNSEIYYSNEFVPFQNNYLELLLPQ
ncbi:772_t:CDS:1, partial [Racocetra fulgida]